MLQNQEAMSTKFLEDATKGNEDMLARMQQLGENYSLTCSEMLEKATAQNEQVATQLNESLTSVVTQISQIVRSECDGLAESITRVVTQLENSYEFIDEHVAQIKSDYEQATLAYRDAVQNAHDNNETIENAIVRMNETLAAVESTNKNIKDVLSLLETRQANIDNLTQRIREVGEAIVTLQNLESTLNKLRG
jgi:DNA repair exonuclease SbcCD ATPase subunit